MFLVGRVETGGGSFILLAEMREVRRLIVLPSPPSSLGSPHLGFDSGG